MNRAPYIKKRKQIEHHLTPRGRMRLKHNLNISEVALRVSIENWGYTVKNGLFEYGLEKIKEIRELLNKYK